jgi:molecular chaperone IbpA
MKTNLSIFNQLRPITIGFDNIFDHFERVLDGDVMNIPTVNYPPYNIVRTGENTYDIELALAGFSKDDINVEYENNVLTVQSIKREETEKEINDAILHRGISKRMFTKSFTVADDVEVNGAELKDGLLRVSLERIIPESKNSRTIEIK